jgi:hypothetical protein
MTLVGVAKPEVIYKFNKIQVVDASTWCAQSYDDFPKNRLQSGGEYAA